MISYVKGALAAKEEDRIIVETGAFGMEILVPVSIFDELPPVGGQVMIYTYFQVREDSMTLYGFLHRQDREMFKQLIGVNGIGPKGALGILSVLRPDDLRMAIISGDAKALSKAPGIGVKTAQRLILDLKDKVSMDDLMSDMGILSAEEINDNVSGGSSSQAGKEAIQALTALGYTRMEAAKAVNKVEITENMTVEDVLKASLKHLSFL